MDGWVEGGTEEAMERGREGGSEEEAREGGSEGEGEIIRQ